MKTLIRSPDFSISLGATCDDEDPASLLMAEGCWLRFARISSFVLRLEGLERQMMTTHPSRPIIQEAIQLPYPG
jgi:hypothetical protein